MKRNDLQTIMRRAWALFRSTGRAFAVCLSKAWELYRLTKRMRAGVVLFAYEKTDGSLRKACGTLHDVAATVKGTGRPDDGQTVKYYDVEADGWRSFKVENLVTVY
ncbi:SH3 beta-barrel fold-containing protein [uncultured Alistipes sp.]|uniref:SH3 beta-barrel fold-containing protein n=1 Tax=uncultured Alistipes sp. TaxID=538949 RepID=UPI0025908D53|nr:SH3 beta-barrel fold-containing protein [uncultured Alistipes sp.]